MMETKSEYKMTELGKIPVEWEIYPLKELASSDKINSFIDGDWIESKDMSKEGIRIIQTGNIGIGRFIEKKAKRYISETTFEELNCKEIYEGDMLICRLADPIGRACLIPAKEERLITSVDITIFRPSKQYDSKYLVYYINSDENLSEVKKYTSGTTRQRISRGNLAKVLIKVPPLKEQQKIAEILSTVDEQIKQTDQLIDKTKELKKGLMQQLLTKGIAHTEYKESECGIIPDNWVVNSIEYICDYRKDKINPLKSERQKYIALENIEQGSGRINGYLHSDDSTSMKSVFKKGDTLFNKLRPYLNKYWYATFDGVCATELMPLTSKNNIDSLFLYYCLQQERVLGYVTQRTFGTKMPRTSWKELKEILIPIPPVNEQKQIAEILFLVDEEIEGYEKERAKYEELKKGLMQQLLTGKTRVKVD